MGQQSWPAENDAVLWDKRHTQEGQDLHHHSWDLHTFWGVGSGHGAVVADPGQAAAAGQEGDPMRPASILWHQLTERHFATPGRTGWLLIYFFTVGRKHSSFEVTGSHCQQDVAGMPVQAEGRGVDGLFNMLAHPSVIFRLKVPNKSWVMPCCLWQICSHLMKVAARLILRITRVSFQTPSFWLQT